ncbi:ABC transporter substrate-binding protein [Methylobacterium indicum]|uniref:ABC transporter substrate-binding protein n=1 Tax=Methylobacterium indicum TaxID=1775910 RepID=UPI00243507CA|nr:ABC transporter substrate-binding protein [Methylobacterium indicum]
MAGLCTTTTARTVRRRRSRRRAVASRLILAGSLGLAACGAARAQVSDGVVKFGVLTDMSSLYADATGRGSVVAAQMAARDFGGTVLGRPIEVVFADNQNKADVGSAIARRWFDVEKVDVILDAPPSSVALAVQQIAKEKNRMLIVSGGGTSDLTGKACTETTAHWNYDTYALAHVSTAAAVKRGLDTWSIVTADYAFGQALERDAAAELDRSGGKLIRAIRAPFGTSDFSSFLLQAQATGSKVVAFANAGGDMMNAVKQAHEFGLTEGGQSLVTLLMNMADVHALGLKTAQGLITTEGFYWDRDEETRAFSKRFHAEMKMMPTMHHAGIYSAVLHHLKAVAATGTDEARAVMAKMREMPVNDMYARNGKLRVDGRMVHDMYLMQVKKPEESTGEWDVYHQLATVPGDEAFRPLDQGGCPLAKAVP